MYLVSKCCVSHKGWTAEIENLFVCMKEFAGLDGPVLEAMHTCKDCHFELNLESFVSIVREIWSRIAIHLTLLLLRVSASASL